MSSRHRSFGRTPSGELDTSPPFKADGEGWLQMRLKTAFIVGGGLLTLGGWMAQQSLATSDNVKANSVVRAEVQAIAKAVQADHEEVRNMREEQRIQGMKLDYLVNGRRGVPPAVANP